tara:strand:+ start:1569 stop:1760 length:192 start_codon:yes stop_codon:yes gene_type:complete
VNAEQTIEETLKILKERPDNKKGIRHHEAVEFLKEIVVPELKEQPKTTSDNFSTPMKMNPWGI